MQFTVNVKYVRPKSFEYAFQPIYYFSRIAGLWPFTIVLSSNGSVEKSRVRLFDVLWFFISIFVYLTALFYAYKDIKDLKSADSITFTLFFMFKIISLLFGLCGVVLDMFNRNKLINILKKFAAFDDEVGCIFSVNFS